MTGQQQLIELLQRQLNGEPSADLVAEVVGSDARLGPLAALLSQREERLRHELAEAEQAEAEAEQAEAIEDERARRLTEGRERAEGVRRRLAELTAELESAYGLLDELAAALGACPGCFGTDESCGWCRGRGAPGFTTSDPYLFDRLVRPAVVRHARLRPREGTTVTTNRSPTREGTHQ